MNKTISFLGLLLAVVLMAGCSAEKFGMAIDRNIPEKKVKDLYFDGSLVGRDVRLEGKISSQCGSNGCWFVLQDETGQIFINLAPNNLTLPPRMNKKARVMGTVFPVQSELQIIAKGVEVR